jgi:hypothetical protein
MASRLPQCSFVYLVSVYVLDPNLQPVAPPLIHFENGVLGIVGNYFGGLFSALSFDFPSHEIPMALGDPLLARLDGLRRISPSCWNCWLHEELRINS